MSNDRLWIYCNCGAKKLLAKWTGSDFWLWDGPRVQVTDPETGEDRWVPTGEEAPLDQWLTEHGLDCGLPSGDGSTFPASPFRLLTESDEVRERLRATNG